MKTFTKLDSGIIHSSIWALPDDVFRAWVAFLALADQHGVARISAPALAILCRVSADRAREILHILESPDEDSRSPAEQGRRLVKIEGGWRLVNHAAYREARDLDATRSQKRAWDREHRPSGHARKEAYNAKSTRSDPKPTTVRRSPISPTQAEADPEAETEKSEESLRGCRLSENWAPTAAEVEWAANERSDLNISEEAAKFFDYWRAKAGNNARKMDWNRVWRSWIRNAHPGRVQKAERSPGVSGAASRDWRQASESPLENKIGYIRQQYERGEFGEGPTAEAERDRKIREERTRGGEPERL